jgi:hypothetical protein
MPEQGPRAWSGSDRALPDHWGLYHTLPAADRMLLDSAEAVRAVVDAKNGSARHQV